MWLACLALVAGACGGEAPTPGGGPVAGWPVYGGDPGGTHYSPLTQIGPGNVARLKIAWVHHSGDVSDGTDGRGKTAFQATPILLDDALYFCSPFNRVFAVDAETGAERWVYDPEVKLEHPWTRTCRGVAAWLDPEREPGRACRTRIYTGTNDARLIALDAASGRPCSDFGDAGAVDLSAGVGRVRPGDYRVTSPPAVIGDVVVVGAMVADNQRVDAPSGVVRGFDARTGALRWSWDPVPPGTAPLPPAADGTPSYHVGTANAWSILSTDPERDLVFVPTGNTSPDFYGGLRHGIDHYSSSVVALRGATGEVVWHFQTVHHDLWDYDVSAQPALVEITRHDRTLPAVAQATKMGHLFLLHRDTGKPIFPVEERPVPQATVPGEEVSPTQPFPTVPPPLHPAGLAPDDAWGLTPWDRNACRERIASHRSLGIFTPPSLEGSILYPGVAGGTNWGGVAFDRERRLLVLGMNRLPNVVALVPRGDANRLHPDPPLRVVFPQEGTPYAVEQRVLVSPLGIPCSAPPWGSLLAVDLAMGDVLWEVPLGTTRDAAPFPFWFGFGLPQLGGPIATASGLVFTGAMDDYLRAFDVETGEELWKARLPAGGQATPMTYRLRKDGRQFVLIAGGGHGTLGTTLGDALVAFALP